MRAFYAFLIQGFRQQAAYKVEGWIGILSSVIIFAVYAGIWTAVFQGDPVALQQQMRYVIATRFLAELHFLPMWEVNAKFRQGDVGLELIRPVALPLRILGEFLGRSGFRLVRALPVYVVIWALFRLPVPGPETVLLFVVSALAGWVILATLELTLQLVALWTVQFDAAEQLFYVGTSIFSGVFIPLYFLPGWIAVMAKYLPFAGVYFVPSAILSGGLGGREFTDALLLQALWALVGVGALVSIWMAGSRKLVMQGG